MKTRIKWDRLETWLASSGDGVESQNFNKSTKTTNTGGQLCDYDDVPVL